MRSIWHLMDSARYGESFPQEADDATTILRPRPGAAVRSGLVWCGPRAGDSRPGTARATGGRYRAGLLASGEHQGRAGECPSPPARLPGTDCGAGVLSEGADWWLN